MRETTSDNKFIVPSSIRCPQHGGRFRVEAQRIVTHADGTRHVYMYATCGIGGGPHHGFGEYVRPAE